MYHSIRGHLNIVPIIPLTRFLKVLRATFTEAQESGSDVDKAALDVSQDNVSHPVDGRQASVSHICAPYPPPRMYVVCTVVWVGVG